MGGALGDAAARVCPNFRLQDAVRRGQVDFGDGRQVDLELRVRGYVAELLRDCPLSKNQVIAEEPEGSAFVAHVRATVPDTGQLLRWVLGCGANVEVLAPEKLREVLRAQAMKMAGLYTPPPV